MRLWNLSSFDQLQESVLVPLAAHQPRGKTSTPGLHRSSSVRVVMRVAALTAVSFTVAARGTSSKITIPRSDIEPVCNVDENRPPLDVLFGGRFDTQWTRSRED